ncbi:MAG: hypothetical protein II106_01595, partial [Oscillospiraceae bacterium]|nr:hypothetical protein [Oscillospiraceae bacterium]
FLPIPAKTIACGRVIEREGGSKTAPFTLPLPGACIIFEGCAFCNSPLRAVCRRRAAEPFPRGVVSNPAGAANGGASGTLPLHPPESRLFRHIRPAFAGNPRIDSQPPAWYNILN